MYLHVYVCVCVHVCVCINVYSVYVKVYIIYVCGVMVMIIGNEHSELSSNPVCISHRANILEKGMHPTILPSALGK